MAVSQWRSDIMTGVTFAEICLYLYHFYLSLDTFAEDKQ